MTNSDSCPVYTKLNTTHCTDISLADLSAEILYMYLFMGYGVKRIESELFGYEEFRGYLSRAILNYYGIETSSHIPKRNLGIYKDCSPAAVVQMLLSSSDPSENCVGRVLAYKIQPEL